MAVDGVTQTTGSIEDVVDGQKLIIWAILLNILTAVLVTTVGEIFGLVGIGAFVLAIVGIVKLADGLGYSLGIKIVLFVLAFVPVVSLLTLAILSGRATQALRAAGYTVGLFGARKKRLPPV